MHLHLLLNSVALQMQVCNHVYADMEAVCVARSLLFDAECSMMFKLSVFVFWVSSLHLNHIQVKSPKQKHSYVNIKLSC
jgi:hypothetical protein